MEEYCGGEDEKFFITVQTSKLTNATVGKCYDFKEMTLYLWFLYLFIYEIVPNSYAADKNLWKKKKIKDININARILKSNINKQSC